MRKINNDRSLSNKMDDMKFPYASFIINLLKIDQPVEILPTTYYDDDVSSLIVRSWFLFNEAFKSYQNN